MMHYEIHFSSGSVWRRRTRAAVLAELRSLRRHRCSIKDTTVEYHRWVYPNDRTTVDVYPAEVFLRPDYNRNGIAS